MKPVENMLRKSNLLSNVIMELKGSATLGVNKIIEDLKRQNIEVIALTAGEPDQDVPEYIKNAAKAAIDNFLTNRYTSSVGLPDLRGKIATNINISLDQQFYSLNDVIVTNGCKQGLFNLFLATLNDQDEIIIPTPYWPSYEAVIKLFKGKPVFLPSDEALQFSVLDLENAITAKTKFLLLNSPNNPTGIVYDPEFLSQVLMIAIKHNIYIIADDIYDFLIYDEEKYKPLVKILSDLSQSSAQEPRHGLVQDQDSSLNSAQNMNQSSIQDQEPRQDSEQDQVSGQEPNQSSIQDQPSIQDQEPLQDSEQDQRQGSGQEPNQFSKQDQESEQDQVSGQDPNQSLRQDQGSEQDQVSGQKGLKKYLVQSSGQNLSHNTGFNPNKIQSKSCTSIQNPDHNESFLNNLIIINGPSKKYAMMGWRLGWLVSKNASLINAIQNIQSQQISNVCNIVQYAMIAALNEENNNTKVYQSYINQFKATYLSRKEFMCKKLECLEEFGITFIRPQGAFYIFLNLKPFLNKTNKTIEEVTKELLYQAHVAVISGKPFGNDFCIRISFTKSLDILEVGINQIINYLVSFYNNIV